tara:strand:+ start:1463 stop:1735 length:273 start_codon:yes stop_codon:yes gene_type:complete
MLNQVKECDRVEATRMKIKVFDPSMFDFYAVLPIEIDEQFRGIDSLDVESILLGQGQELPRCTADLQQPAALHLALQDVEPVGGHLMYKP